MHYWPNCDSSVCLSTTELNSHLVPDEKMCMPFKPYVWGGWEYGGIGICCESDESFQLKEKSHCIATAIMMGKTFRICWHVI